MREPRWRTSCVVFALALSLIAPALGSGAQARITLLRVRITGVINPIKARYVERALAQAHEQRADAVLLSLDTPGGMLSSMQEIIGAISNANLPVIGLVEPRSAQATSAGALILLACDVAAMYPDTRVGAAHPVGSNGALEGAIDKKATNSLASLARSLAERHGRSQEVAEAMVRESKSYTAREAQRERAIELVVDSHEDLLHQLDGFAIDVSGTPRVLHTRDARIVDDPMSWPDRVLDAIAEPTIASLLVSVGTLAIAYELAAPGIGLGGVIGVSALLLGLLSLSLLPVQLAGAALLVTGAVAIAIEALQPTHGLVGLGGLAAIGCGALVLVEQSRYFGGVQRVDLRAILPVLALFGLGLLALVRVARRASRTPPQAGLESLPGMHGVAKSEFRFESGAYVGVAFVAGARWLALSDQPMAAGQALEVIEILLQPTRLRVRAIAGISQGGA